MEDYLDGVESDGIQAGAIARGSPGDSPAVTTPVSPALSQEAAQTVALLQAVAAGQAVLHPCRRAATCGEIGDSWQDLFARQDVHGANESDAMNCT